ncbi:MAG: hypothetical protein QXE95_02380 [Candidatus Nitrosocaldus sp.]
MSVYNVHNYKGITEYWLKRIKEAEEEEKGKKERGSRKRKGEGKGEGGREGKRRIWI